MTSVPCPGAVLSGKYRVLRLIGSGGMGTVFEAENLRAKKRVAIKWLHTEVSLHEEGSARLMREAEATARIRHPNVVDVYDVETDAGTVFLVMEYLEGEPLTRVLERRELSVSDVVGLLLPAMRGVAAAHREGVIHRDIKPDNIFLAREAESTQPIPKVLDFGISRLEPLGGDPMMLTRTGAMMGTPLYMSFEQLSGAKDIDARTDVYAFGVILYEVLTGRHPYTGATLSELIINIATQSPPSPRVLRPQIPSALADITLRAMAKDRGQRFGTVDALIHALAPFAGNSELQLSMAAPDSEVSQTVCDLSRDVQGELEGPASPQSRSEPLPKKPREELVVSSAQSTRPPSSDRAEHKRQLGQRVAFALAGSGAAALILTSIPSPSPRPPPEVAPPPAQGGVVGEIHVGRAAAPVVMPSTHVQSSSDEGAARGDEAQKRATSAGGGLAAQQPKAVKPTSAKPVRKTEHSVGESGQGGGTIDSPAPQRGGDVAPQGVSEAPKASGFNVDRPPQPSDFRDTAPRGGGTH